LWLPTPTDDREFTKQLYVQENVLVLPGQYLAREINGENPGQNHVRIALVAPDEICHEGISKVVHHLASYR
jgi:N-succinyldiaminopimelate aminotransferase